MVSTAAFHARIRGSVPGLGGLKETKNVSSPSTCESQYCGEPPWIIVCFFILYFAIGERSKYSACFADIELYHSIFVIFHSQTYSICRAKYGILYLHLNNN